MVSHWVWYCWVHDCEFILFWLLHINVLQNKESCFNVAYMLIIVMYNTPPPSSLFPSISSPPVVHESSNGAGKGSEPHPGQWPGGTFVRPHYSGTSDVHHYTVYGVVYRGFSWLIMMVRNTNFFSFGTTVLQRAQDPWFAAAHLPCMQSSRN